MDIKDVLNIPDILQFEVKANIEINGIQYDSRKVVPGNIFLPSEAMKPMVINILNRLSITALSVLSVKKNLQ